MSEFVTDPPSSNRQDPPPQVPGLRQGYGEDSAAAMRPSGPTSAPEPSELGAAAEILDACCGGRMWWWDKAHPLAVCMDNRIAPTGSRPDRPNWEIRPDVVGDFRAIPFLDGAFRLVLFDPPHIVRPNPSGRIAMQYGALAPESEQDDLRRGLAECWRVVAPGGTLVLKWAGALDRVRPHFPSTPVVGTRATRGSRLGTRWIIFYKPLAACSFGGPSSGSSDSMEVADGPPEEQIGISSMPWDDEEGDYDHA